MSISIMTKDGPLEVPTRSGGVNLELLARIRLMEDHIAGLQQELAEVKQSRAGSEPGLTRLSAAKTVTDSTGLALPTSENNASVDGTLANRIKKNKESFVWKKICDGVSQEGVPNLYEYAANEFMIMISDGYVIHSKSCPKIRAPLRIEQSYALAKCRWIFNLWKTSRQIEIGTIINSDGDAIEPDSAKITVYYR